MVLITNWTTISAAIIFIGLRLVIRMSIKRKLGLDDGSVSCVWFYRRSAHGFIVAMIGSLCFAIGVMIIDALGMYQPYRA